MIDFQTIVDERDITKLLGIQWQPFSSELQFELQVMYNVKSKQSTLSLISKLFIRQY